jgi:hypothetical protein
VVPYGLGLQDFNRPGQFRLSERYRQERRHSDALRVAGDGLSKLLVFPVTFDGSLPGVTLGGERSPLVVGERYNFEGAGPGGADIKGTVADACVMEGEKAVMVAVNCEDGTSSLLREPMSDAQLADYKAHPDAYFGRVVRPPKTISKPMELFEFFMDSYRSLPRDELLKRLSLALASAESLGDDELRAIYCEGLVSASGMFTIIEGVIQG